MKYNLLALMLVLLSMFSTIGYAKEQIAPVRVININNPKYANALCNNGKAATYNFILSKDRGLGEQDYRKKWLVVLSGGGKCIDEASCSARWKDNPKTQLNLDGIGSHANMVPALVQSTRNFDGNGILDFDGQKAQRTKRIIGEAENPFRGSNGKDGFNRVWINYCSSDSWGGLGTSVTVDPVNFPKMAFDKKNAAISSLYFGGAKIVESVIDLIMKGQIQTGGLGGKVNPAYIPDAVHGELVLAGSSAGGNGTIRNLDAVAHQVKSINPAIKVYGIIDAISTVGTRPDVQIGKIPVYENGDGYYESANFYTNAHPEQVMTDYDEATGTVCDNSKTNANGQLVNYCYATTSFLLRDEITTPYFVVQQAYDVVIHEGLKFIYTQLFKEYTDAISQLPGLVLSGTPSTDPVLLAESYIRNRITSQAVTIGVKQNNRAGLFIPNYAKGLHQIMTDSQRFHSSERHQWNEVGSPNLGVEYVNTTVNLPTVLGNFRSCVLMFSQNKTAYNNCINTLWSNSPAEAIYDDVRVINTTAINRP